jgi:hypothetical protein
MRSDVSHVRQNPKILKLGQNKLNIKVLFSKHSDFKCIALYKTGITNYIPFQSSI